MSVIIYDSNDKELDRVKDVTAIFTNSKGQIVVISEDMVSRRIDPDLWYLKVE